MTATSPSPSPLHAVAVTAFAGGLRALKGSLAKGEAFARERGYDPARLLAHRLAPDMLDLAKQVQVASDFAKNAGARLTGATPPSMPDTETTVAELVERLERTALYVEGLDPADFAGSEARDITFPAGPGRSLTMPGEAYLHRFAAPNLWFHLATAHAILRAAGVPVGKRDFMGMPG